MVIVSLSGCYHDERLALQELGKLPGNPGDDVPSHPRGVPLNADSPLYRALAIVKHGPAIQHHAARLRNSDMTTARIRTLLLASAYLANRL